MLLAVTRKVHETDDEVFGLKLDEDERGFVKVAMNSNLVRGIIPVKGDTVGEVSSVILYQLTEDNVVLYQVEQPLAIINQQLSRKHYS